MEELLTLEEASRYLKINKMTLYKMAWENKIPVYRVGRQWRFKKSVLDEWLEETRVSQELFQPRKKCIFLTGATGYLGSHLVPKFIEEGFSLKLLVRAKREDPRTRILECLSKIYPDKDKLSRVMDRIEILEGDMTQRNLGLTPKSIQGLSKEVSVLFHCAASVTFDEEKEAMLRKNNIEGIKNILSFAKRLPNIHLHYMGTAYVCGQRKGIVKEDELYLGQTFYNSYEKIKCEAEGLVRKWADKYNSRITIYRPSVIVGDYDTGQDYSNYGLYGIQRIVDLNIRKFKLEYKIGNRFLKDAGKIGRAHV